MGHVLSGAVQEHGVLEGAHPSGSVLGAGKVEEAEAGVVLPILPFRNHL